MLAVAVAVAVVVVVVVVVVWRGAVERPSVRDPNMQCFYHSDFEMCCAPQQRALSPHLNVHKCSEPEVL